MLSTTAVALQLLAGRGATLAQISLRPAALGGIEVRLRHVAGGGIEATLLADQADTARSLQQAGNELRRMLEAQGVDLLRLDVDARAAGDPDARRDGGDSARPSGAAPTGAAGAGPVDTSTTASTVHLLLPDGATVDVLA
ncbi:MAG: flagellar hook-length control protein FliK [Solirubrobacteraceae bacterium]|nr:flagellar hook-length control protein FliK [Solirubrobacteraceae bacterium]